MTYDYIDKHGTLITLIQSEFVANLPTPYDWKNFLATRPAHATWTADDGVMMTCLCCGKRFSHWPESTTAGVKTGRRELWNIRVGGLIKRADDTADGPSHIIRRYKVIPVIKTGLGCEVCVGRFEAEVRSVNGQNSLAEKVNLNNARLSKLTGEKLSMTALKTAFVNVLNDGGVKGL